MIVMTVIMCGGDDGAVGDGASVARRSHCQRQLPCRLVFVAAALACALVAAAPAVGIAAAEDADEATGVGVGVGAGVMASLGMGIAIHDYKAVLPEHPGSDSSSDKARSPELSDGANGREQWRPSTSSNVEFLARPLPAALRNPSSFAGQADAPMLQEWHARLSNFQTSGIPKYPAGKFSGRGIVMTAGRRSYFTAAYVSLSVIRKEAKSRLPIEVFYGGSAELPQTAIDHMHSHFDNIRFVDITQFPAVEGVDLRGYQMKIAAIYFSSFEEVLWLDSDNMPLTTPDNMFSSKLYQKHGAVLWPDVCNMISVRRETFEFFGMTTGKGFSQPRDGRRTVWPHFCAGDVEGEVETGQILFHKQRQWEALNTIYFLNVNSFFMNRLFHGDKMTFHFGFHAAGAEYGLVPFQPASIGVGGKVGGKKVFCGNTLGQKHPDKNKVMFLHRNSAKLKDASSYFTQGPPKPVWTHVATQGPKDSWNLVYRNELPAKFFAGEDVPTQGECLSPRPDKMVLKKASKKLVDIEQRLFAYLQELRDLPFYPGYRKCNAENRFFCKVA